MSSHDDKQHYSSSPIWTGDKLDGTNFELYSKLRQQHLRLFGDPGKSVADGIDRFPVRPSKDDLIPGTNTYVYDHLIVVTEVGVLATRLMNNSPTLNFVIQNSPGASVTVPGFFGHQEITYTISEDLSLRGSTALLAAIESGKKDTKEYLYISGKLITFSLTGINDKIQSELLLIPPYLAAKDDNMSFEFSNQIKLQYGHCTNGRMISIRTQAGFLLRQTGSHQEFCHNVLDYEKHLNSDLGGTLPLPIHGQVWLNPDPTKTPHFVGTVLTRSLTSCIYQVGLNPNDFALRLEGYYAQNPSGVMTGTLEKNMSDNTLYLNSKASSIANISESTSSLYTHQPPNPIPNTWTIPLPANLRGLPSTTRQPNPNPNARQPAPSAVFTNNGRDTICAKCKAVFPTTKQIRDPSKFHTRCRNCFVEYDKLLKSQRGTATTSLKKVAFIDPKSAAAAKQSNPPHCI